MTIAQTNEQTPRKPLRLWPGVVAVVLQWLARFGIPVVVPGFQGIVRAMMGGMLGTLAVLVWWVFFSRARWSERLGAIVLMPLALGATWLVKHESMGPAWLIGYATPVLCLAFVTWAVASRRVVGGSRWATMVATILLASGVWTAVRTTGMNGVGVTDFKWRWRKTVEDQLLAKAGDQPVDPSTSSGSSRAQSRDDSARGGPAARPSPEAPATPATPATTTDRPGAAPAGNEPVDSARARPAAAETAAEWPGFRGPARDDIVRGVRIETDWSRTPPVALWRRPIGPGWSSFAVRGHLLYTQEQRGADEIVACHNVTTGRPVWTHRDATRFFESNGGAGPRATPTLSGDRVYTFGATGILNALDARQGSVVWSRNAASDIHMKVPMWGFAGSPLVVDDVVIVAVAGTLVGYDLDTGSRRWSGPRHGFDSYSSPHRTTIDGLVQVLLQSSAGVTSVAPATGAVLWEHPWPGFAIVQPAMTADGDVLISVGNGTRRIAVAHGSSGWTVEERWTSVALKPYFNDFVVHKGHAFGFDGSILACIDLKDGKRTWKGGRYGNGQLVLLPDQDVLLVLSEEGELALVRATPDQFTELARFPALEGKTWNHPVLLGDVLLVRNGEEMAAFRLSLPGR